MPGIRSIRTAILAILLLNLTAGLAAPIAAAETQGCQIHHSSDPFTISGSDQTIPASSLAVTALPARRPASMVPPVMS